MCRFLGYLGRQPGLLSDLIIEPENSLMDQSCHAREEVHRLNADGFGVGWYDHTIRSQPGIFKSIQPAWNDLNLRHIASMIQSTCFIGHVRASSVGGVSKANCHPFSFQNYLFMHNGTITEFAKFQRPLCDMLDDESYRMIQGHTDSEHFFALLIMLLKQQSGNTVQDWFAAMQKAIQIISNLQDQYVTNNDEATRINAYLTDGHQVAVMRYVSDTDQYANSLHYTIGKHLDLTASPKLMQPVGDKTPGAVLVASEVLNNDESEWIEIPVNHCLLISADFEVTLLPCDP